MNGAYLERLTLSHFRSHRQARLAFDGRPVAIHGPNGAGKTNLIEAISLFSPGRGLRRAGAEELMRKPEARGWKLRAEVAGRELETWAEPGFPRQVRIDGKAATQTALSHVLRVLWLVPAMDRLWIESAEGRRRFLDRITLSFVPGHAEASLAYERSMRDRNRLLKDQVTDAGWYGAIEAQMAQAGALIGANRRHALARLRLAAADAETAFPAAELSLTGPNGPQMPEAEDELLHALNESRRRDLSAGRTLVGPHRVDLLAVYAAKGVEAGLCSTGEQKALLISLILANMRALAAEGDAPRLLLLDEVAAHLDETRRAALYDEVVALGVQAFMTGTGSELFAELGTRAQVFEVTETDGQSAIREGDFS